MQTIGRDETAAALDPVSATFCAGSIPHSI
jgi:hypothetical protein